MSAALPCAGGTYNYAKQRLNHVWTNMVGWHYFVSVVAIGAGETLAFSNYFKILMEQFGLNLAWLDSRIIALILDGIFLVLIFLEGLNNLVAHRLHSFFSSGDALFAGSFI